MTQQHTLDELHSTYRRDYDPYSNVTIAEHLTELADRRASMPISYSARGNGCWVLTKYDDIAGVLRRSNRGFISFPNDPDGQNSQGSSEGMIPIEVDGIRHKQFRAMLDPNFAPNRVAELEDGLREWANRLIDEFIESGECDFVTGFALPFPGVTVLTIMGWPTEDLEKMNAWTATLLHGVVGGTQAETDAARGKAHGEMRSYMLNLITERRNSAPRNDVTSAAIDAEIDGKKLTDLELFDLFLLMMTAGLDTVQSVLSQSAVYLANNPHQWEAMFAAPESLGPAIEELIRWGTPPVPTRTIVADSVQVGDLSLPRGERVHFPLAAANRDPQYYPDPNSVVFDRQPKPHLAFGLGAHRCVGLHLARLELKIAFTELHRRIPNFVLDSEPNEHLGLAWGVDDVRLKFTPGPRES